MSTHRPSAMATSIHAAAVRSLSLLVILSAALLLRASHADEAGDFVPQFLGAQLSGTHWHRADDRVAIAFAVNGLSHDHRDYLAAGGSGFLLDDGRLNYGRERILDRDLSAFHPRRLTPR